MNQTQIDSIRETQASQVQERKMREDEAARLQKEWDTNRPGLNFNMPFLRNEFKKIFQNFEFQSLKLVGGNNFL